MRLICTLSKEDGENPYALSQFLKENGIDNQCEEVQLPDEGVSYRIWVIDEEQIQKAQELHKAYKLNPVKPPVVQAPSEQAAAPARKSALSPSPFGPLSICVILLCVLTFLWGEIRDGVSMPPKIPGVVEAPIFKTIDKAFAFDYPHYFELRDALIPLLPQEGPIPPKAQALISEMKETPFWGGFYDRVVAYFTHQKALFTDNPPLFEKIRQGEVWRLFTPAVLHFNFLHILFNLLWFIMLGNQIEWRVGRFRYLFLMLVIALVSNVAQYLMSGSFFLGLSGVVVGLAGFVWARQQVAPWEGYLFQRASFFFLLIFILGVFFIQVVFFALQLLGKTTLAVPIANTAHLVGGLVGYVLGRLKFFTLSKR